MMSPCDFDWNFFHNTLLSEIASAFHFANGAAKCNGVLSAKRHKNDPLNRCCRFQKGSTLEYGYATGVLKRISERASTYGWERYRRNSILNGESETTSVTLSEQFRLSILSIPPAWAHRVNHKFCGQQKARRDASFSDRAANPWPYFRYCLARGQELRTGGCVYGPINASAPQHPLVCGVDDRVAFNSGDIAHDYSQPVHRCDLLCSA